LLSSFVPVLLADPWKKGMVIEHLRKIGALLSALGAKPLVLSDAQTPKRQELAGPADGHEPLARNQWKHVAAIITEIEQAAAEFGLSLVFHPHVATYVEIPSGGRASL